MPASDLSGLSSTSEHQRWSKIASAVNLAAVKEFFVGSSQLYDLYKVGHTQKTSWGFPRAQRPLSPLIFTQMVDEIAILSRPTLLFHTSNAYKQFLFQGLKRNHSNNLKPFVYCVSVFVLSRLKKSSSWENQFIARHCILWSAVHDHYGHNHDTKIPKSRPREKVRRKTRGVRIHRLTYTEYWLYLPQQKPSCRVPLMLCGFHDFEQELLIVHFQETVFFAFFLGLG